MPPAPYTVQIEDLTAHERLDLHEARLVKLESRAPDTASLVAQDRRLLRTRFAFAALSAILAGLLARAEPPVDPVLIAAITAAVRQELAMAPLLEAP